MSARDDVRRWVDPDWWCGWNRLTVSDGALVEPLRNLPESASRSRDDLRTEGWAQVSRPSHDELVERLREGVLALHERKMPAVFLWSFDETWALFGRLDGLWREILGEAYRALPCFWGWHLPMGARQSGWPPHRDRSKGPPNVEPDGQPSTLTAWIPLGRATPENGCMYVVPAPLTARDRASLRPEDARALPAEAGDVLLWRQDVWHWGGRSSAQPDEPRISVGLELQAGLDVRYQGPLLDPLRPPPLAHRLALIGANIGRYKGFVRNPRLISLGKELVRIAPECDERPLYP